MSKVEPTTIPIESPQEARLYQYTFWSRETKQNRRKVFTFLVLPLLYTSLLMWACLSLFWGSLIGNNSIEKITVTAVNLDTKGFVGNGVIQGIHQSVEMGHMHLQWKFDDSIISDSQSRDLIMGEKTWAVLQVSPDASSSLTESLNHGNRSYTSQDAIMLYVASARNQITTLSNTVPAIMAVVNPILARIAVNHTASFLQSTAGNQSALATSLKCPQCLASPFAITTTDLIPFDSPSAFGAFSTGMIFLLTFTFNVFLILRASAEVNGSQYRLSSALTIRTISSLGAYFMISLMYSLIVLAFDVPLHRKFGNGGFMIFWMLNWCTMGAVGLPMESLFTIIGLNWAGYFLNVWLIVNTAGSFNSFELMPGFYQYGYAFPFYHTAQATRTIIFSTKSHLGLNFGVLIIWMAAGLSGIYVTTYWRIRKGLKEGRHVVP